MKFLFLLCSIIPNIITASTGGNCKNVCNYQIDNYWTPCLDENCPQIGELCTPKNATTCVCSNECQMCVEDLYRECGDCTDKYGYDFNKEYGPTYKKLAEDMGCNSGSANKPKLTFILFCMLLSTIYLV